MHAPVDPPEVMSLQVRVEKAPEGQIETVAVFVRFTDVTQRLERYRKFRAQRSELQRLDDGQQRSGEAHVALAARIELSQGIAVDDVQVLVDADTGHEARLPVAPKTGEHVSVVEAVVAGQRLRKGQGTLVHQCFVESR